MAINQKENLVVDLRIGKSYGDKPKRKSSGGVFEGKSYGDKPKRKSSGGESGKTNRKSSLKKLLEVLMQNQKKDFMRLKRKQKIIIFYCHLLKRKYLVKKYIICSLINNFLLINQSGVGYVECSNHNYKN